MSKKKDGQRRHILFAGEVQGVGFRYTTRTVASRHAVAGFVRNLSDGRVELVVEGGPAELDAFLKDLGSRMEQYIRDTQTDRQPATGEFDGFEIRF